jgi:hypothetical protein
MPVTLTGRITDDCENSGLLIDTLDFLKTVETVFQCGTTIRLESRARTRFTVPAAVD